RALGGAPKIVGPRRCRTFQATTPQCLNARTSSELFVTLRGRHSRPRLHEARTSRNQQSSEHKRNICGPVGYLVWDDPSAPPWRSARPEPVARHRTSRPALTAVGAWLKLARSVARRGPTGAAPGLLLVLLALGGTACDRDASHRERREDTLTSGRL